MNRLSLRNNRLKFKTLGKLSFVLEELENIPQVNFMSTCNPLDLETLRSRPIMPKDLPRNSNLRALSPVDHEVVPKPCKICDWMLNSSHYHFGLTPREKKCQSDHGFRGPQSHILRPTLSTDMVQRVLPWERQTRCCGR
jgi:hypothetical protein